MKNKKGEIATLLTLGLVVVGSLITLGSSLFINNQKTNLASNSMAANPCVKSACPNGTPLWVVGGVSYPSLDDCNNRNVNAPGYTAICSGSGSVAPTSPPAGEGGTSPICGFLRRDCFGECTKSLCTAVGCGKKGTSQTYRCKSDAVPTQPPADDDSGTTGDGTSGTVSSNGVPNPEAACCFVSNAQSVNQCSNGADYIRVYAHADVRVNSDMSTPCTSASYGNAYGASKWFYCADSTVDGCENEAGYDLTEPIVAPIEVPIECQVIDKTEASSCSLTPNMHYVIKSPLYYCCPTGVNPPAEVPAKCIFDHTSTCTSGGSFKVYKSNSLDCSDGNSDNCWGTDNKTCSFTDDEIKGFFTQFCSGATTPSITTTPISSPTMKVEGSCKASGSAIKFGNCSYFEKSGKQNCSNSTPVYSTSSCTIFRVCGGTNCRYDCYENDKQKSCVGVGDPQTGYDYIRIVNSSTKDIVIGKIIIEKMQGGGNPVSDQGGATLKPGETKTIDLNQLGGTYACSALSINSIRVILFNPDGSQLTSATDGCGGGVKILINLK